LIGATNNPTLAFKYPPSLNKEGAGGWLKCYNDKNRSKEMRDLRYPKPLLLFFGFILSLHSTLTYAENAAQAKSLDDLRGWLPTERKNRKNPANLRLKMLPNASRRIGETMQIKLTSQETGYLFLLDINSAGQLTRIFPNKYSSSQLSKYKIKAGQTVIIPDESYGFDFTATEPMGKGLLVAFLVEEDYVYNVRLPEAFKTIQVTEAYKTLQQLNQYLNAMLETDKGTRPVRRSITTLDYHITH
jgi:hypothetical protein